MAPDHTRLLVMAAADRGLPVTGGTLNIGTRAAICCAVPSRPAVHHTCGLFATADNCVDNQWVPYCDEDVIVRVIAAIAVRRGCRIV